MQIEYADSSEEEEEEEKKLYWNIGMGGRMVLQNSLFMPWRVVLHQILLSCWVR